MSVVSAAESRILSLENSIQPLHSGALMLFNAAPLREKDGRLRLQDIRDAVWGRLHRVPRYRQRLCRLGVGSMRWAWRDDPDFDISYHVRHTAVPFPGDEAQLLELVNRVLGNRLDPDRPLWELWVVEGLADDRVAIVHKSHPLLVGGRGAIDLLTAIMDPTAEVADDPPDLWEPSQQPTPSEVAAEMVASTVGSFSGGAGVALDLAGKSLRSASRVATAIAGSQPLLPWQVDITAHRRFETVRISLDRVLDAKRVNGCSFNDVVLAACTDALRVFLESRDVPVEGRDVEALVPLAIANDRERSAPAFSGGRLRMVGVDLPVGERDASARLDHIAAQLSRVRTDRSVLDAATLVGLVEFAAPTLLARAGRAASVVDDKLVIVNVPGSRASRWFMGAELLEMFPYLGIRDGRALTIATISHGDQLSFGITGDRSRIPDLHHFARYLRNALDALV